MEIQAKDKGIESAKQVSAPSVRLMLSVSCFKVKIYKIICRSKKEKDKLS